MFNILFYNATVYNKICCDLRLHIHKNIFLHSFFYFYCLFYFIDIFNIECSGRMCILNISKTYSNHKTTLTAYTKLSHCKFFTVAQLCLSYVTPRYTVFRDYTGLQTLFHVNWTIWMDDCQILVCRKDGNSLNGVLICE